MRFTIAIGAICAATQAWAVDPCLVGVWDVDAGDMAVVMEVQLGNAVRHVSGRASVQIDEAGVVNFLAENLVFSIAMPDIPPMDIQLVGYGIADLTVSDGTNFQAVSVDYNLVGSADVFGERLEVPFTTANAGWGNTGGVYGCSADSASFEPTAFGTFPRELIRVR